MSRALIVFLDKNYGWGPRMRQFGHAVLLEQDERHHGRWLLRQWRNRREHIRILDEADYTLGARNDPIPIIEAIKHGMLDLDMNEERDNDVTMIEVSVPTVMPLAPVRFFRATDVGYIKARLGVRSWFIRTPRQLYRFFKDGGPDAVEKRPGRSLFKLRLLRY